jgi:RNA polymerase sigma factor for flagellar operon FliA
VEQRVGRVPEEAEIAAELSLSVDNYRQKRIEMEALNIGEMEFVRDENGSPLALRYAAAPEEESPSMALERVELERLVASSLDRIPTVEKTVLSLYFYEELTLREISEIMGIHLSRVSQIKSQAIPRLRTVITKHWPGVRAN